jgi:hypothetical protein
MKKVFILVFFASLFIISCSKSSVDDSGTGTASVVSSSSVPQVTRNALTTNFSGATEIEWQRHSSSSFEVQFNHSSQRHSAGFDDSGHQSSHSIVCIDAAVPQVVLDAFRQRFATDNVYEWKLRNDGTWKAHFMRSAVKYEATYSSTGILLKFEIA